MNKPFELAADAKTREIDCTHFSRSDDLTPFCNCLVKPYCVEKKGDPGKCSFRISKTESTPNRKPRRVSAACQDPTHEDQKTMAVKWI